MKFGDRRKLGRAGNQRHAEHDQQHRRLREGRDHDLAAGADAAETGADIHPGEREEEARASEQRDDRDQVGGPVEQQAGGEGRHQRGGNPDRGKGDIGRHAEQPRGVVGQHHFLAQQSQQIAIGLKHRRRPGDATAAP